jgi:hypothetical protein
MFCFPLTIIQVDAVRLDTPQQWLHYIKCPLHFIHFVFSLCVFVFLLPLQVDAVRLDTSNQLLCYI